MKKKESNSNNSFYRWMLTLALVASVLLIGLSYVLIFRPDLISVVLRYGMGILCGAAGFGLLFYLLKTIYRYLKSR